MSERYPIPAVVFVVTLVLAGCGGGGGGDGADNSGPTYVDPTVYSSAATASLPQAKEIAAVTRHQIVVGGATLAYTATTGHLTASHPTTGAPEASFFYVAYTLDNRDAVARPVTFFYNGGP